MFDIHPAAELFPLMATDEFEELKASVKEKGLLQKIVICDGKILDGRHRYRACQEAGVPHDCVEWSGEGGSPTAYVLATNLKRRHLTAGQRSAIADGAAKLLEAEARERSQQNLKRGPAVPEGTNLPPRENPGKSVDRAAKATGVSASSTKVFRRLSKNAPELARRVSAGELSLNAANMEWRCSQNRRRSRVRRAKLADSAGMDGSQDTIVDALGEKVPERLQPVFAGLPEFQIALRDVSGLKSRLRALADGPSGGWLEFNQLQQHLDNARHCVTFAMPYCLCCYCDGIDKNCKGCRGEGWITKAIKDQAPNAASGAATGTATCSTNTV